MTRQTGSFDYVEFHESLKAESDRAAAVLGVAYLDNILGAAFKRRLNPDTPSTVFEFRGPLGDFASRIEMAFALGWIDEETRKDLTLLRKIRNDFAHDDDYTLSFGQQSCSDRLAGLAVSKIIQEGIDDLHASITSLPEAPKSLKDRMTGIVSPRARFEISVAVIGDALDNCIHGKCVDTSSPVSASLLTARILAGILRPLRDSIREASGGDDAT